MKPDNLFNIIANDINNYTVSRIFKATQTSFDLKILFDLPLVNDTFTIYTVLLKPIDFTIENISITDSTIYNKFANRNTTNLVLNNWNLVTELTLNSPMNNPWTGTGQSGAASVLIPLNTLSSSNGRDLEIKIEWDNNDGTTSSRFYKGWYLNEVFDYTRGQSNGTVGTVYAKWNETDEWYESTQHSKNGYTNNRWNWMFNENSGTELNYNQTMSGKIGYHNVGFLVHGSSSNTEIANGIYSGGDENKSGKYSNWQSWSKLRVYVNIINNTTHPTTYTLPSINNILFNTILNNDFITRIEGKIQKIILDSEFTIIPYINSSDTTKTGNSWINDDQFYIYILDDNNDFTQFNGVTDTITLNINGFEYILDIQDNNLSSSIRRMRVKENSSSPNSLNNINQYQNNTIQVINDEISRSILDNRIDIIFSYLNNSTTIYIYIDNDNIFDIVNTNKVVTQSIPDIDSNSPSYSDLIFNNASNENTNNRIKYTINSSNSTNFTDYFNNLVSGTYTIFNNDGYTQETTSIPYKQRKINITVDSNNSNIITLNNYDYNDDEIESFYQKIIEDGKFKIYDSGWKDVNFTVFQENATTITSESTGITIIKTPIEKGINISNIDFLDNRTNILLSLDIINQFNDVSEIISLLTINNQVEIYKDRTIELTSSFTYEQLTDVKYKITLTSNLSNLNDFFTKIALNYKIQIFVEDLNSFLTAPLAGTVDQTNKSFVIDVTLLKSETDTGDDVSSGDSSIEFQIPDSGIITVKSVDVERLYITYDISEFQSDNEDNIIDFVRNNDGQFKADVIGYKIKIPYTNDIRFIKNKKFFFKNIVNNVEISGGDISDVQVLGDTTGNKLLITSGHIYIWSL